MAAKVIVFLLCATVCIEAGSSPTTSTHRTPYTYTSRRTPATTRRLSSHQYYYYMDNSLNCNSLLTKNFYSNDKAYVNAWTHLYSKAPLSSCTYTFYSSDVLEFYFTRMRISDCSVTVNIYLGDSTLGTPWFSYTCSSSSFAYTNHHTATADYITIELNNRGRGTNYDFQFYIENHDYSSGSVGETVGLAVGFSVFFIIIVTVALVCRRRHVRMRRLRSPPLISSTTTTATPSYNYPVGQSPYPQNYGSANTSGSGYQQPQAGAYPPPAAYPPAGGYQQPGGGAYPTGDSAPPPPDYSTLQQPPPAGAYKPAGGEPYPQPPAYGNVG